MHYFFSNYFQNYGNERLSYIFMQNIDKQFRIDYKQIKINTYDIIHKEHINIQTNLLTQPSPTPQIEITLFSLADALDKQTLKDKVDIDIYINTNIINNIVFTNNINIFTCSFSHIITFIYFRNAEKGWLLYVNAGNGCDI